MELLTDETFVVLDCAPPSCQIRLEAACKTGTAYDCFVIEVRGSIPGCPGSSLVGAEVRIDDVTEGAAHVLPILAQGQDGATVNPRPFSCQTELGTLPPQGMHLEAWTVVARVRADWLVLARSGRRSLLFHVHIFTGPDKQILTSTKSIIDYQNPNAGYIEIKEHLRALRLGATALAFATAEVDRPHTKAQFDLISQWVAHGLDLNRVSYWSRCKYWLALKAMAQAVARDNPGLQALCQHIVRTTPCAQRYDIMALCIQVMAARNSVSQQELTFIRQLNVWLQLDPERIRAMVEKVLPVTQCEELDVPSFLGITPGMSPEQMCKHLNREYAKWNARVTHPDPGVQAQAEQMLELIAHTRSQCARERSEGPTPQFSPN